jgi:hypothetical protein
MPLQPLLHWWFSFKSVHLFTGGSPSGHVHSTQLKSGTPMPNPLQPLKRK